MFSRIFLYPVACLLMICVLGPLMASCDSAGEDTAQGRIVVYLHDSPADFEELRIHIQKIWAIQNSDGSRSVIGEPDQVFNILELVNGNRALLVDAELEAGSWAGLVLELGPDNSMVVGGSEEKLVLSGDMEIKIDHPIRINDNDTRIVNLDIDAARSVRSAGKLDPVIRAYDAEKTIALKGRIHEKAIRGRIVARRGGSEVASTFTEVGTGEFLLQGLSRGTYDIEIIPDSEEYPLVVQSNIILFEEGSTRSLGTYALSKSELLDVGNGWSRRMVHSGAELLQYHGNINGELRFLSILAVSLDDPSASVRIISPYIWGGETSHRMPISEYGERSNSLAATNAGFAPGGDVYHNYGIIKIEGQVLPFAQKGSSPQIDDLLEERYFMGMSAIGIDENENWFFAEREGDTWDDDWLEVQHAIAGGHLLISDGVITEKIRQNDYKTTYERNHMNLQHPRTAVCKTADRTVALFVLDGRQTQAVGMSLLELSEYMLGLGCIYAINFDGGGSTTMWTEELGVVNHPTDNDRFDNSGERNLRNAFIIRAN